MRVFRFLLVLVLVSGCQGGDRGPGSVLRYAVDGNPGSLDPAHAGTLYASILVVNLFDTLYRYQYFADPPVLAPNLASAMPEVSEDGMVYTLRLREDVRFADSEAFEGGRGRLVVASDVVYSLKRHFKAETQSRGAWLWRGRIVGLDAWGERGGDWGEVIEGLHAVDDHTVRIHLVEPFPQFPYTLAMALSAIVPREAVEFHGRAFGVNPVGSGPFRLVSLDEMRAVLESNPEFREDKLDLRAEGFDSVRHAGLGLESLDGERYPFLDRLEVHFIAEPNSRWISFMAGDVDTVMVPPEQASRVVDSLNPLVFSPDVVESYHAAARLEPGFLFYGFNMGNPAIGHAEDGVRDTLNRDLRCGMRAAFDWEARNATFYDGLGRVFPGVIPPFLADFDEGLDDSSIRLDPDALERAVSGLLRAGLDLPSLVYGMESSLNRRQMFEQFSSMMRSRGLPAGVLRQSTSPSFGELVRAIDAGDVDLFLLSWIMAYPDPGYNFQLFYGPNAAPGANSFRYSNPEFDALFRAASQLSAGADRASIHARMNEMLIEDCVVIGSMSRTRIHLWSRSVALVPNHGIGAGFSLRVAARTPANRDQEP